MPPSSDFQAQSQVEEKERPYRSIFEAAGDGLLITDGETGRVIEANPAASTLYSIAL
jgi:PAS domain-containing protein